ncbi:hypothetical protein [uncultured Chryseobacterium sp.]|uniref:hypothetical protein n=1 Tax=uncultured Chryseobacterium sp. TaxID=259322 RepID=UPI0025853A81|nr:hypothetical protein [uncultured Chryseobacterium sp.]
MNQSEQKFSTEEWEICLKVLNTLKEEPLQNPDNKVFSGLITKIHKNAKRQSRLENYSELKSHNLAVNSNSDHILKGSKTLYSIQESSTSALPQLKTIIQEIIQK